MRCRGRADDVRLATRGAAPRRGRIWQAAIVLAAILIAGCSGPAATGPRAGGSAQTASPRIPADSAPPQTAADISAWLAQLRGTGSPTDRVAAVEALAAERDPRVAPALEAALADPDLEVRTLVATVLGDRGEVHAVKALAAAVTAEMRADATSAFVAAAATALGRLKGAVGVPALIVVLRGPTGNGRQAALDALAAIGAPAVPALQRLLANPDVDARLAGVDGLFALGKSGVKPLIAAVGNSESKVASRAANRLGYLGDRAAEAALVAVLDEGWWKTPSIALARLFESSPSKLLRYLNSAKTFHVYYGLMFVGADSTVTALAASLMKVGDLAMAEEFLNCGNPTLEGAAEDWASAHGYSVTRVPGSGDNTWGSGLPE